MASAAATPAASTATAVLPLALRLDAAASEALQDAELHQSGRFATSVYLDYDAASDQGAAGEASFLNASVRNFPCGFGRLQIQPWFVPEQPSRPLSSVVPSLPAGKQCRFVVMPRLSAAAVPGAVPCPAYTHVATTTAAASSSASPAPSPIPLTAVVPYPPDAAAAAASEALLIFDLSLADPPPGISAHVGHVVLRLPFVRLLRMSAPQTLSLPPATNAARHLTRLDALPHAMLAFDLACGTDRTVSVTSVRVDPSTLHCGRRPAALQLSPLTLPYDSDPMRGSMRLVTTLKNDLSFPLILQPGDDLSLAFSMRVEVGSVVDDRRSSRVDVGEFVWAVVVVDYTVVGDVDGTDQSHQLTERAIVEWAVAS